MMTEFGKQLRYWRKNKGLSQLDLALHADVSSKHISFIETGRSKPSREMVFLLATSLDLNLRNRNDLLTAAGFSEGYNQSQLGSEQMQEIQQALQLILQHHAPYPALAFDWHWNILMANSGFQSVMKLFQTLNPKLSSSKNIVDLTFDPNGLKPFIVNWEEVASLIVQRLHREHMENPSRHQELMQKIFSYSNIPKNWRQIDLIHNPTPTVQLTLKVEDQKLNLFTILSSFGTPIDITAEEITIEHYFPADDQTRAFFDDQ